MKRLKDYFVPFIDYLRETDRKEITIERYREIFRGAFSHGEMIGNIKIKKLKLISVGKVMQEGARHGKYGPWRAVLTFRKLIRFIEESGNKVPIDWRRIEVPRRPAVHHDYWDIQELKNIIRRILSIQDSKDLCLLRTKTLLWTLFSTGCRPTELLQLNREDISWKRKEAIIPDIKSGEDKTVYFTDKSIYWLKRYFKARKDNHPAAFVCNENGKGGIKRLSSVTSRLYLQRLVKERLGINKKITHYTLRRLVATYLLEHNCPVQYAAKMLGHSYRTTLQYYALVDQKKMKRIHQEILGRV